MDGPIRRRQYLFRAAAIGLGVGLAGCLDQNEASNSDSTHDHDDHDHSHGEDSPTADSNQTDVDPALVLNGTVLSDAFPIELVEPDVEPFEGYADPDQGVANVHWHGEEISHWHFQPVTVPPDRSRQVRTRFVDQTDQELPLGHEETYFQSVRLTEETPDELISITIEKTHVTLSGKSTGSGRVIFQLRESETETVVWTSPELEVEITE
jgi:hypothetical protein